MMGTYVPTACSIPTESSASQGHPYAPPYVREERGPESQSLERVGLPGSQDTSQDPNFAVLIGVYSCIPSNKLLILAQRANIEHNQLFADSEAGSHRASSTREEKVALGCVSSEPIQPLCINHKEAAATEMLPCKTAVLTST